MKVYLVDTPGFGETNKQAEQAALAAMASSSVYVLCMDYEHTEGTKQREFIKNHLTKSEGEYWCATYWCVNEYYCYKRNV